MKPTSHLIVNIVIWLAVMAIASWLAVEAWNLRHEPPPSPGHAPRTVTAPDGAQCHLWPLETRYGRPDPNFFWLCPDAGENGYDTWGLAWDFNDIGSTQGETP